MNEPSKFKPRWVLLPGIALVAILAAGLIASIDTLAFRHADWSREISWRAFADGEMTGALAKSLQASLPFADALVTAERVAGWIALGDLGPRVRTGCEGWLFLADELVVHPDREAVFLARVAMVERVAKFLESRGIALLVVPVPDKARLAARELCRLARSPALADRLQRFSAGLATRGIRVADVTIALAELGGDGFYRTDTHWNERGARVAAEAVATELRRWNRAPAVELKFEVTADGERERIGDLIRLAGLAEVAWPLRPRGDSEMPVRIRQKQTREIGILDDVVAPGIAVIGTSYSRRANFMGFLALALGAPVANFAQDGGGVFNAAMDYFANRAFTETPPRTVVWEIPERLLDEPLAAQEQQWAASLPPAT